MPIIGYFPDGLPHWSDPKYEKRLKCHRCRNKVHQWCEGKSGTCDCLYCDGPRVSRHDKALVRWLGKYHEKTGKKVRDVAHMERLRARELAQVRVRALARARARGAGIAS